tara:strand:- start:865 stop:1551 length:687 start_codon:yes stop_codon:yes gene_type:complete
MDPMKIYCVRIGDKYSQLYEDYINKKLSDYDVVWIKEPIQSNVPLQWNKMIAMNDDSDEPVLVLDIDNLFINDYKIALDYPIEHGEFLCAPYWWGSGPMPMSGGFYKFYPKECKYIYDTYMSDINFWTNKYIKDGSMPGPVAGEFLFVYEHLQKKLKLKLLPDAWVTRWNSEWPDKTDHKYRIENKYYDLTGNDLYNETFHPDIKLVHFTHSLNKPHEWSAYAEYNKL